MPVAAPTPVAPTPVAPTPVAAPAPDAARLAADAELALTQAPPAAGHAAPAGTGGAPPPVGSPPPAADAAATAAPPVRVAEVPRAAGTGERNRRRGHARTSEDRAPAAQAAGGEDPAALAPGASVDGPCTGTAETLSLCSRRAPAAAEPGMARATAPAPASPEGPRAAPARACDQTRAVLGLCGTP
jgi:hypothetical protein